MKILLISGHGAGDSGAVSQFGREADETIYMVKEIQKTLSQYVQVDLYPTDRNAYSDAKAGKLAVNFGNYGYVLEVHFNACVNDTKGDGKDRRRRNKDRTGYSRLRFKEPGSKADKLYGNCQGKGGGRFFRAAGNVLYR